VWYRYTSVGGGSLEVDTFGSDYETFIAAWRGSCGALGTLAACNGTDHDNNYSGEQSRLVVTLAAGETIYLEILNTSGPAGGNLVLNVKETTAFRVTDEGDYIVGEGPDVAAAEDGTFLIVWEQDSDTIMGRRYCDTGVPLGAPFPISGTLSGSVTPRVARTGSDFVVVWYRFGFFGRRISGSGVPIGPVFEVSEDSASYYWRFDAAGDPTGGFVVAWSDYDDGDEEGVVARRFDASGTPLGPEFAVNTYTAGRQMFPSVASDPVGNSVIVWESRDAGQDGSGSGIFGRRFDASGSPMGGEFLVNATTASNQERPAVATDPSGAFVVAWQDFSSATCGYECVVGRRFDAAGSPQGGDFEVSPAGTEPPSFYQSIDAGRSDDGDFIVSWANEYDFPRARGFDADGTPQGPALQMAYLEDNYQRESRLAVAGDGDFQVVWEWAPIGSGYKVMGRAVAGSPSCPAQTGCPSTPRTGCKQPTLHLKGNLTLKNQSPDSRDAIIWKWVKGEATTVPEIGNPLGADSYTLCLYDGDDMLQIEAVVPPGGTCTTVPCWKDLGGIGFKYADKTGAEGDVRKLLVKSGIDGRAKVVAKAQGGGVAVPALPPVLPLRAQLSSSTGTCWEAEFRATGVTKSTPTVFGAKPHVGSPGGAFVD